MGYAPLLTSDSSDHHPAISVCPSEGGGVGFVTWDRLRTTDSTALLSLSILMGWGGGGSVDTWYPLRTPNFSVYVCPSGCWMRW